MDRIDESKRITIDIIPLSTNIYIIAGEHVLDLEHNVRRIAEIRGDDVLLDSGEAYNPEFLRKIVIKAGNNTFDLISQQWDIALDLNLFSKENRKKDLRDLFEFEYIPNNPINVNIISMLINDSIGSICEFFRLLVHIYYFL